MKTLFGLVTGGFDVLHEGHINLLKDAKSQCACLVVGLNSDEWLAKKKGDYFMDWNRRFAILKAIRYVDEVINFNDSDGTACDAINTVLNWLDDANDIIVFMNGGDRDSHNTPENETFADHPRVRFVYGVGGEKVASSSEITLDWERRRKEIVERGWGTYEVLGENEIKYDIGKGKLSYTVTTPYKVKKLVLKPGGVITKQKHNYRSEIWSIINGSCRVQLWSTIGTERKVLTTNMKNNTVFIRDRVWHQATNLSDTEECVIIEVQYGEVCRESDIVRPKDE